MQYRKLFAALGVSTAAALFTACSGSSTAPSTSSSESVQAAEDVSDEAATDVGGIVTEYASAETDAGAATGDLAVGPLVRLGAPVSAPVRSSCTTGTISSSFTFPASDNRDTVSYTRTWEFFSAAGCENAFVSDSTDSIAFAVTFAYSLNGKYEHWHAHRDGTRSHALTGDSTGAGTLLSTNPGIRVWNGNALVFDTASFSNAAGTVQRSHLWQAADTASNITFPHPRNGDVYPISGAWKRWVADSVTFDGATSGSADYMWHIVVTFSATGGVGNQDAQLQIFNASGALVKTCEVDLLVDEIVPGSCQ